MTTQRCYQVSIKTKQRRGKIVQSPRSEADHVKFTQNIAEHLKKDFKNRRVSPTKDSKEVQIGIDEEIITHKWSLSPSINLVSQRKRRMIEDKRRAVDKEVH
ncbi:unnamed protein product [Trifolium pratense]|uniref:Uncharacterized protein n=1 Tax=Trifolium pratense TaxID=57577 RepID=A0ACB0IDB4_TRIPR|nr:unnamed protein product [Trifolium pratense]